MDTFRKSRAATVCHPVLRIQDERRASASARLELPAGVHGGAINCKLRPESLAVPCRGGRGHDALGSPKGDYVIAWGAATARSNPIDGPAPGSGPFRRYA